MAGPKTRMPADIKRKCAVAIHTATAASAAAGAIPIPMSDAIPITGAQIAMIVALGKVFGVSLSQAAAKSIMTVTVAQSAGRAIFSNVLKVIPGAGSVVGATTAAALTEGLGWLIADDFFRMSQGEEPENIVETTDSLRSAFDGLNFHKAK